MWGNQSSERVEAEDEVLSPSVSVCVCVSLCNLSRFFRHAVRAKTTNQTTLRLRLRLGPGRRRSRGGDGACLMPAWMVGGSILIAVAERKRLLLLLGICN